MMAIFDIGNSLYFQINSVSDGCPGKGFTLGREWMFKNGQKMTFCEVKRGI